MIFPALRLKLQRETAARLKLRRYVGMFCHLDLESERATWSCFKSLGFDPTWPTFLPCYLHFRNDDDAAAAASLLLLCLLC